LGVLDEPFITGSARTLTESGYASCGAQMLPVGAVVMSSRAPIGHLGIAAVPLCTNQGCKSFVPGPEVDSDFLYLSLRHVMPAIQRLGSGAVFAEVSKSKLEAFEIELPPVDDQRRIAAAVRQQLARVRTAAEAQAAAHEAAGQLLPALLREAFPLPTPVSAQTTLAKQPSGWAWRLLTSVARLESGHTPSRLRPEWWGGDVPWLALPDIRALDGKLAYGTTEYTNPLGIAHSSARILPAHTVVMSRTASVGFVTMMGRPMATSQDFVNWVCGPDLDPFFLAYALRASRTYLRGLSSGAVHKTIYMPTLHALQVCMPPLNEQRRIVAALDARIAEAERLRAALAARLAEIETLPASILRAAFAPGAGPGAAPPAPAPGPAGHSRPELVHA
jgi:type I restriction enzyme S subunit